MKKRLWKIIFAVLFLCTFSLNASAAIITIGIEATVTSVTDSDNLLEGNVIVGSIITGTYTYDTDTPDTNPASEFGDYWHYDSPFGLELAVGGFVFKTDTNDVEFLMGVANNYEGYQDNYLVRSYNNLSLDNGTEVNHISWQLDDYSGTALSSTDLPTMAPILSNWDWQSLGINGGIGGTAPCYEKSFGIGAEVTSVFLIPEPMSLLLLCAGGLLIRTKRLM